MQYVEIGSERHISLEETLNYNFPDMSALLLQRQQRSRWLLLVLCFLLCCAGIIVLYRLLVWLGCMLLHHYWMDCEPKYKGLYYGSRRSYRMGDGRSGGCRSLSSLGL